MDNARYPPQANVNIQSLDILLNMKLNLQIWVTEEIIPAAYPQGIK